MGKENLEFALYKSNVPKTWGHFFEVLEDTSTKGILFQDTNIMMLSVLLIFPLAMLANGCPEQVWPECNWEEELSCWGGLDAEGCEMPHYCFPNKNGMTGDDGTDCWSTCPMMCGETEVICPGEPYNGCPMGDFCAPADVGCPTVRPPATGVECGTDEMMCGGGIDTATGCEMPGHCIPSTMGNGTDGNPCWSSCPAMCDYAAGQMYCDGGFYNGCPMGGYCAWPYGDCPAMCGAHCDYDAGEHYCDMGTDDNGCWMGNFCSTEECPAGTYGR